MLFMVIETFRNGGWREVGERFRARGRMIPENSGVEYVASWMLPGGAGCFQVMRAPSAAALEGWLANWRDLVDFEVVEVQESKEFWAGRA